MKLLEKHRLAGLALVAAAAVLAFGSVQAAQLEEIVVTSQKRTESLQDVPISITTISGDRIDQAGMLNLEDLTSYIPNLMLSENAVATSIVMRGVGPGANQSFEQSVGLFLDGVHLAKGRQSRTGFFDLEQVEVLRGPQGTLFGKNTLAGAINVTSASPDVGDEFDARLSVSGESNAGLILDGSLEGTLTDTFALRFAIRDSQNDGYFNNSFINKDAPAIDETIWRLSGTWEPTDNTTVKIRYGESQNTRVGNTAVVNFIEPVGNLTSSAQLAFGVLNNFFPQVSQNIADGKFDFYRDAISIGGNALAESLGNGTVMGEKPEGTDTATRDFSLNIEHDFGDGYTFSSVTGYSEYEYEDGIDADFLPIRFVGRSDISEYDSLSQELRIASDPTRRFSFIAGTYFNQSTQDIDRTVVFDGTLGLDPAVVTSLVGAPTLLAAPPALTTALGVQPGVNGVSLFNQAGRVSNWVQDVQSWAVFAQGEYQLSDSVTLTAGLRYTEEDKDAKGSLRITTDTTGLATPNASPVLGIVLRGISPTTYDHDYVDSRTTDQFIPSFSLEWDQSDTNLFYLSYAEGFKTGGFNAVDDQAPDLRQFAESENPLARMFGAGVVYTEPGNGWLYEDETAQSIAFGGKHTLAEGSMTLNWEVFTSEYDDLQVSTFVGVGFVVRNAASAQVDGLEANMQWQATENLLLGADIALLDASYNSFPAAGCTAIQESDIRGGASSSGTCTITTGADGNEFPAQDLSGGQLNQAPDYSGSLFASYNRNISQSWDWFFNLEVNFTDAYTNTGDLDPIDTQTGFEKINFQTGIRNDNLEIMLYGRNVTDELTASGGFDVPLASGAHAIYTDPGAIFGARIAYNF